MFEKPSTACCDGWVKEETASDCTADTLCEEELVILFRYAGHHEAEDVEEGAHQDWKSRAVIVNELACYGTLDIVSNCSS